MITKVKVLGDGIFRWTGTHFTKHAVETPDSKVVVIVEVTVPADDHGWVAPRRKFESYRVATDGERFWRVNSWMDAPHTRQAWGENFRLHWPELTLEQHPQFHIGAHTSQDDLQFIKDEIARWLDVPR